MKRTLISFAAVVAAVTAWALLPKTSAVAEKDGSSEGERRITAYAELPRSESAEAAQSSAPDHVGSMMSDGLLWSQPIITGDHFTQNVFHLWESSTLTVRNTEENPDTGDFEVIKYNYSASFQIRDVDGRESGEFYVAGRVPGQSETVIEKWVLPRRDGEWYFERATSPTPIGQPVPGTPNGSFGIELPFVPVNQRMFLPALQRTELYRGFLDGGALPTAICVDPEGRFLVFSTDAGELYRMSILSLGQEPEELAVPAASGFVASICTMHHPQEGRLYWAMLKGTGLGHQLIRLSDQNNDGIFENSSQLDLDTFDTQYGGILWDDDFVLYMTE